MPVHELLAERSRDVAAGRCAEVPSPCISVCRMDPSTELCEGCWRTLDEIASWSALPEAGRREVWKAIGRRIALAPALSQRESEREPGP